MRVFCLSSVLWSALSLCTRLQADTPPINLPAQDIEQIISDLQATLKDSFQIQDVFSMMEILQKTYADSSSLSATQKQQVAIQVLQYAITNSSSIPYMDKQILSPMIPVLSTLLFPGPIEETLTPPQNGSPSDAQILSSREALLSQLENKLDWDDIGPCLENICQFVNLYPSLLAQDKAYIAKQTLCYIIDQTDTPFVPDVFFDEIMKRIGCAVIDYIMALTG